MSETDTTIEYYEEHADDFVELTLDADMSTVYTRLEKWLNEGDSILDLGCGSGRDSRYFSEKGYEVTAVDPSPAMCRKTREIAKVPVYKYRAEEIPFVEEFNGVWACASLLHVEENKMKLAIDKIAKSLKPGGVAYMSWKSGSGERQDGMRHYTDYAEDGLKMLLSGIESLEIVDLWTTVDSLQGREGVLWTNVVVKKHAPN